MMGYFLGAFWAVSNDYVVRFYIKIFSAIPKDLAVHRTFFHPLILCLGKVTHRAIRSAGVKTDLGALFF